MADHSITAYTADSNRYKHAQTHTLWSERQYLRESTCISHAAEGTPYSPGPISVVPIHYIRRNNEEHHSMA